MYCSLSPEIGRGAVATLIRSDEWASIDVGGNLALVSVFGALRQTTDMASHESPCTAEARQDPR